MDLGGGQGRNCLPLARMGFEVVVVDSSPAALDQVAAAAAGEGLSITPTRCNALHYAPNRAGPPGGRRPAVPPPGRVLQPSSRRADRPALVPGGLFYLSMPGFDACRVQLARRLLEAAGCGDSRIANHLVTRQERPRLAVPRRNETRAFGFKR